MQRMNLAKFLSSLALVPLLLAGATLPLLAQEEPPLDPQAQTPAPPATPASVPTNSQPAPRVPVQPVQPETIRATPTTQPHAGIPAGVPVAAPIQAPVQAPIQAGQPEQKITLQFPMNPATDVIDFYERVSGKRLIRDANLAGVNLTIVAPEPVPKSEALQLIEGALLLNGYVFVDAGNNTLKILNTTTGKSPRSEGVPLYADMNSLPETEAVVAYFLPLTYITTEEATQVINAHVQPHGTYGSIVAVPNAQALVITENVSLIRQIIRLKELIDVPPARTATEFVQLRRANAERVVEAINGIIEARKQGRPNSTPGAPGGAAQNQPQGNNGNPNQPNAAAVAGAIPSPDTAALAGDTQVIADTRTNRVLIITRPAAIAYLRDLIYQFDSAVELMDPYERPLQYLAAAEALPVLADLLAEDETDRGAAAAGAPGTQGTGANRQQNTQQNRGFTGNNGSNGSNAVGGIDVNGSNLQETARETAPQSLTVGKTTLIADNSANSILVIGPPENRDKVRTILDRLDQKPLQVYLSTVIGQLTLGDGLDVGVDILQRYVSDGTHGIASIQRTRDTADPIVQSSDLINPEDFPLLSGLTVYGHIDDLLDVFVRGLQDSNRFRVLSRPSVYTANNKRATIISGQQVAVPTSTLTTVDTGSINNNAVTSNIQYRDVVLKLAVLPLINSNHEVTLQIDQANSTIIGKQVISGNEVPIIGTQSLNTTVTVPNRSTVVLGGLITDSKSDSFAGTPFLSKIPVLGYLFRNTKKQDDRTELIVLIQPTVIESTSDALAVAYDEQSRAEVGTEIRGSDFQLPPGEFVPTLPPSPLPTEPVRKVPTKVLRATPAKKNM